MKEFNQRWQTLAQQAGGLGDEALPELPFGFAARVMARSRESAQETWEEVLSAFSWRAVMLTACGCVIAAGLAFSDWYEFRIERPELERTITSELSWP